MKEKVLRLNLTILFLLFAMMLVSPSAASLKNPVSITVEAKSKKKPEKKSPTRKPVTRTNYITMKKKEKLWIGPSVAAMHPETKDWKSSNSKIATVSSKGDEEGFHKVTVKKKGTVTISCTVKKTLRGWIKGDVHKWVITIK